MSLFKVCTWWSAQCPDLDENYDVASLLCSRFGLEQNEKDYIAVGSHSGDLSIFYPKPDGGGVAAADNFKRPTDLLLESHLKAPILGLLAGRFTGFLRNENTNQLAILHPNNLAIYNLMTVDGVAEHGTHSRLQLIVEHTFKRGAFAFTKGHFGQVKGREFLCIVHLDGTLTFYEQDGISYECLLPGPRPLPSSVVYCEMTDSFLRFNSSWELECFTYQDLSQSAVNESDISASWFVCLGEGILDIIAVQTKESCSLLMILGERNFICVNDQGEIGFILKLDYSPKCFTSFLIGYYWEPNARLITAIISESSKLLIYEDSNLIWAAQLQLEDEAIAIKRSNINGLAGGIVTLGARGQLHVGYLGSEPFVFKVPQLNMQPMNFEKAHKELMLLEEEIKQAVAVEDIDAVNQCAADDLRIKFVLNSTAVLPDEMLLEVSADVAIKEIPTCSGCLRLKSKTALDEIQVAFNMAEGIQCSQRAITYTEVDANTTHELNVQFYVAELLHVHSAKIEAVVSFINRQGIPRVLQKAAYLPLAMFFKTVSPQKAASTKITFNVTSKVITTKISTIFPEFIDLDCESHALGLSLHCSPESVDEIITIVAAKNSNRIRIQSDCLESFALVLERIVNYATGDLSTRRPGRDKNKGETVLNSNVESIIANPTIPYQEILHRIDEHQEVQENIHKQTILMDSLWTQYKSLQLSLRAKIDGEPIDDLQLLIEKNYDDLIAEGDKLVEMRSNDKIRRCNASCALSVAIWIISCLKVEEKIVNLVTSALCVPLEEWTELSWEETVSPGIDMLHRYGPLNPSKSVPNVLADASVTHDVLDYDRFRRHFAALFDRICRLAARSDNKETVSSKQDVASVKCTDADDSIKKGAISKRPAKHSNLEALADDVEEVEENNEQHGNETVPISDWVGTTEILTPSDKIFSKLIMTKDIGDVRI